MFTTGNMTGGETDNLSVLSNGLTLLDNRCGELVASRYCMYTGDSLIWNFGSFFQIAKYNNDIVIGIQAQGHHFKIAHDLYFK
jgi:hypothetical protein